MADTNIIRILIIEDNPDIAELVSDMLASIHRFEFNLIHEDSLSKGIKRLKEYLPSNEMIDIVLLDLNLPDSDGAKTFERVFHHAPWVPVVLLTGEKNEELALELVRMGAQDYLVKDQVSPNLLSRAITYAIERKQVEVELRHSEERFMLAVEGARDGIWDWDLKANKVYFSPRWKRMLGYSDDEIKTQPSEWLRRIHQDDLENVRVALSAHVKGMSDHFESEHRIRHKDGSYRWVLARGLVVRNGGGIAYRMAGSLTDITLQKHTEEKLIYDALHDNLTGLPNRALFMDRLERSIEHVKRHVDHKFAVLFLDLDRFKVINDSLGHSFGDRMLVAASDRLGSCLRAEDSIARIGGDEFVILLGDISQSTDALIISDRIQKVLRTPFDIDGQEVVTSASIGIVISDVGYDHAEDVLRDADIAMYHAKMLGKACHVEFHPSMRKRAIARMGLENDLRKAIENENRLAKEFSVVFQPIISLGDGHIVAFEALLRWTHPTRGPVGPVEFIPIAEETGLIHQLGVWVLRQACAQVARWQGMFNGAGLALPISVNVNISGKQFTSPNLVDQIDKIIKEFGIDPSSLNLEITESSLLESKEPVHEKLEQIKNLGVNFQVDDFGKGYSSYRYLQRLPVNSLKIDAAYIHRLGAEGSNSKIVGSIVGLAKSLGLSVIAEGVETEAQYEILKELDCPYVQGFYISYPVSGDEAGELLRNNWAASERQ